MSIELDPLTEADMLRLLLGQRSSTDLWIREFEIHRDASSMRNAAMAIGKYLGLCNVLLSMSAGQKDFPIDVQEACERYAQSWSELCAIPFIRKDQS